MGLSPPTRYNSRKLSRTAGCNNTHAIGPAWPELVAPLQGPRILWLIVSAQRLVARTTIGWLRHSQRRATTKNIQKHFKHTSTVSIPLRFILGSTANTKVWPWQKKSFAFKWVFRTQRISTLMLTRRAWETTSSWDIFVNTIIVQIFYEVSVGALLVLKSALHADGHCSYQLAMEDSDKPNVVVGYMATGITFYQVTKDLRVVTESIRNSWLK